MSQHSDSSTRERLLTAAKKLFLEKTPDQVSVRAINAEAGLNPGAVHYHFGSREGLIAALLEEELLPLWSDRMAKLLHGRNLATSVDDLVVAFVEPFAELVRTGDGRMLCHLLARATLPTGQLANVSAQFLPAPFEVMVGRALPELSVHEVAERCGLAFSLVLETYGRPVGGPPRGAAPFPRAATVIAFVTAGLTAPPAGSPSGAAGAR
ncbi:TetR/AcrR family transcriptional regulator [Streptomyces sp. NBC_01218]|uniref:TetR/AcrR family transcriptional regulator n=1 Tax=unclassified Streptomyces TaxID=2593676 RepID=UPI0023B9D692|nr:MULTISPECIES: TetR/AcrR family transcriptional regulator [unclassified Streptomyces]WEH38753.1 TetR/AcrR family transcriptional regulator [Streptomyces sp. AM 2-1-1]WSQ50413.1 TetR/AcrR family transcriptional regulator [Streptomyces sp. NBC_01218]